MTAPKRKPPKTQRAKVRGHHTPKPPTTNRSKRGGVEVEKPAEYPDAFTHWDQPRDEYLTVKDMGAYCGVPTSTVTTWCRVWFGELSSTRKRWGYRIPHRYRPVARAFSAVPNAYLRQLLLPFLIRHPSAEFLVMAHSETTTNARSNAEKIKPVFYTAHTWKEAVDVMGQISHLLYTPRTRVEVIHVGEKAG